MDNFRPPGQSKKTPAVRLIRFFHPPDFTAGEADIVYHKSPLESIARHRIPPVFALAKVL